ncbi:ribonuclease H protein [Dorcoceras hygrometricum]|uniref:Ribonuclease H protein n=1 Tax=Dorcoceras hygrometricum TaxID=472368 RepID=A0A2Z7A631_9LAMI|nr:ribonuclease H protein [Dorcoceras hygrometricum]
MGIIFGVRMLIRMILCYLRSRSQHVMRLSICGSVDDANNTLGRWFEGNKHGSSEVYKFFMNLALEACYLEDLYSAKTPFIFWVLAHKKLLTGDHKQYIDNKLCALCHDALESKELWSKIKLLMGVK